VIAPATPELPYPVYPENVDDHLVLANEIRYPDDLAATTELTGFRFALDVYTTMNGIMSVGLAYGMDSLPWSDQRRMLEAALVAVKGITEKLPLELQLTSPSDQSNGLDAFDDGNMQYVPPGYAGTQLSNDVRHVLKTQPHRRRQLQYEIQKANIHVSQLATRSYFVEMYFNLRMIHLATPEDAEMVDVEGEEEKRRRIELEDTKTLELMTSERELIVQDLLTAVQSISQRNMEPNGGSIINKIRQVASTLLNMDDSNGQRGPYAEALTTLIHVLVKLEKTGPSGGSGAANASANMLTPQDEEEELRYWADLREYQARFASHGGYAGNI
jgi:hypothetical protein